MAYNLQSLIQVLEQTLHPQLDHHLCILDNDQFKSQLESLLQLAHSLEDILEKLPPSYYKTAQALMGQIRDAAYRAEDIIELYVVDQILANFGIGKKKIPTGHGCGYKRYTISCFRPKKQEEKDIVSLDLPGVHTELLFAMAELQKIIDQDTHNPIPYDTTHQRPGKAVLQSELLPSSSFSSAHDVVVGLENDMLELKDRLIGQGTTLQVIPIVGMGGIGKTTLARQLFHDSYVSYHFDTRTWATVSQDDHSLKAVLLSLLGCIPGNVSVDQMLKEQDDKLGDRLYKSLSGKRYLVVLDDIWSNRVWDRVQKFFPKNNNGSRIILTTRGLAVANYASQMGPHHQMHLLNDVDSWNLLREKVFEKAICPRGLEKIGRSIASCCKGLPLAIQVIGGLLLKEEKTEDYWHHIANDVSAAVADQNDQRFSKILSLSFDHLPLHLRSCFLYIGCFPEDYQIRATKIKRLFVAEGFLKPIKDRTLEEAAEEYLKALADRSLLFVRKLDYTGEVKCYVTHDLIRNMCKRKAQEEKFFNDHDKSYVTQDHVRGMFKKKAKEEKFLSRLDNADTSGLPLVDILREIPKTQRKRLISRIMFHSIRRFSVNQCTFYPNYRHLMNNMLQYARSFIQIAPHKLLLYWYELGEFKLLRVLDLLPMEFEEFPDPTLNLVNIRYLALRCHCRSGIPNDISRLRNLQSLMFQAPKVIFSELVIPVGLWRLAGIRHIKLKRSFSFPISSVSDSSTEQFVLENLLTLSYVNAYMVADSGFVEKVPNLNKLGMYLGPLRDDLVDISGLLKLTTLKLLSSFTIRHRPRLDGIILPPFLKKICLTSCWISGRFMSAVGSLPNLEVFNIRDCTMWRDSWEPVVGEFVSLKFLQLDEFTLRHWRADESHYPSLRHLVIQGCLYLEEIPPGIGDIQTMEVIEVDEVNRYVVASAKMIQEEQLDLGNDSLHVLFQITHLKTKIEKPSVG